MRTTIICLTVISLTALFMNQGDVILPLWFFYGCWRLILLMNEGS